MATWSCKSILVCIPYLLDTMIELALATEFNFAQIKEDSSKLAAYEESQRIEFVIDESRPDIYDFVVWNMLDIYTTHRGIEKRKAKELNPLLPDHPHLDRLIIHKVFATYTFHRLGVFEDKELVEYANNFGWLLVYNNGLILYD